MNMSALRKHVISSVTEQRLISHGLTLSIEKDASPTETDGDFTVIALQPTATDLMIGNDKEELLKAVSDHVDAICQEEWDLLAKDVFWKPVYDIGIGYVKLTIDGDRNDLMVHGKFYGVIIIRQEDLNALHKKQILAKTTKKLVETCLKQVSAEENGEVFTLKVLRGGESAQSKIGDRCYDIGNEINETANKLIDRELAIIFHCKDIGWRVTANLEQSLMNTHMPLANHIVSSIHSKLGFMLSICETQLSKDGSSATFLVDIKSLPPVNKIALIDGEFPIKVAKHIKELEDLGLDESAVDLGFLEGVISNDFSKYQSQKSVYSVLAAIFEYVEGVNLNLCLSR